MLRLEFKLGVKLGSTLSESGQSLEKENLPKPFPKPFKIELERVLGVLWEVPGGILGALGLALSETF